MSGDALALWLIYGSDPERSRQAPPPKLSLSASRYLIDLACAHGVLPAVLRKFAESHPDDQFSEVRRYAQTRRDMAAAHSLVLRAHADLLETSMQGVPGVMVKGPTFARALYPAPFLRTFTDIDLLISIDANSRVASILESLGFWLAQESSDGSERKWLSRNNTGVMVEVHTNLVHDPRMRRKCSLAYEDIASVPPAVGYLVTAALHGAIDGFRHLRQIVDVCQAARRLPRGDEGALETLLLRSRAHLALAVGLEMAFRLFREERCRELAGAVPVPVRRRRAVALMQRVIGASPYSDTSSSSAVWRRRACRALLRSA
ncbi:nucleotidyltransferase family protein [Bradyrhizobium betae]|jgi:Uncharacterised nucleotidyltransferase|uniref:nucleotidyltransferase family protein n=1 Tax=Bradyrhizobium betae TaxID=244734 RepID=UPI003D67F5B4